MKIYNQILYKVTKKNFKFLNLIADNGKFLNFVKIAFLLLGVLFLTFQLRKTDFEPIKSLSFINFFITLFIVFLGTTFFALPWYREYKTKDDNINSVKYLKFYFQGQLGKYIPGSIWSVLGRIGLASNDKISLKESSQITTKHLIKLWGSCLIIGSIFYFKNIFFTMFLLIFFIYFTKENVYLLFYLLGWLFICLAYIYVSYFVINEDFNLIEIISSTLLSWLGGFLFLPSPSGIGVREYLFTYFYSVDSFFNELFIIATYMRLVTVINDTFGFFFYSIFHNLIKNKKND